MAFEGYLVKVLGNNNTSDYIIPLKYIDYESYHCIAHGQDLEPFTNQEGITNRNPLKNAKPTCEFNLMSMSQSQFTAIMSQIQARYVGVPYAKEVKAKIWNGEYGKYINHTWYVPDIDPPMESINNGEPQYNKIRVAFISKGGPI